METHGVKDAYASVLKGFVDSRKEQHLVEAAELGRELVRAEIPPEEIAEIHEEAIQHLAQEFPDKALLEFVTRISAPLMEMLMAYGLVFREWSEQHQRAEAELREHRDHLEILVDERTADLREANDRLQREISERKRAEERLVDYQNQLRSLASQLSLTEERERRRIAWALHDHIAQPLVFARIKLGTIQQSGSSSEMVDSLGEICRLLDRTIEDIRSVTFELSYPPLYELGFEAAVEEWLNEQVRDRHGIRTRFVDDGRSKPMEDDIRAVLFQAVRELLVNVVKHAEAKSVTVTICKVAGDIEVTVKDDGVGFDVSHMEARRGSTGGFGLFNIRERLEYVGGRFRVESAPGRGTWTSLTAPLKDPDPSEKWKGNLI